LPPKDRDARVTATTRLRADGPLDAWSSSCRRICVGEAELESRRLRRSMRQPNRYRWARCRRVQEQPRGCWLRPAYRSATDSRWIDCESVCSKRSWKSRVASCRRST
jgi:hypothetical protein